MNAGYLERVVENCSTGFDEVEFCWHGGEPLLSGIEFYRRAVKAQESICARRGVHFRNSIQTNGTLLNDDWLDFFEANNFQMGLSCDVPARVMKLHRGINLEVIARAINRLRSRNLPAGALCVVTKENVRCAQEIFDCFVQLGVTSYSLLPLKSVPLATCPSPPDNDELFQLYKDTFEIWAQDDHGICSIEPISSIIEGLLGKRPRQCSFASSCLKRMIAIDQEFNIVPCSSLVSPDFVLGNIVKDQLARVLCSSRANALRAQKVRAVLTNCHKCEFLAICRGGCRADAYWQAGVYTSPYPSCAARRQMFQYLRERLTIAAGAARYAQ